MPSLVITCESCQATFRLPESVTLGAKVPCPKCKAPMKLRHPAPEGAAPLPVEVLPIEEPPLLEAPKAPDELGWLGPYRILGKLGEGGMGIVFEAEDTVLLRRVALKVMQPKLASKVKARSRFLREARAQAAVEHQHVATIHSVGEEQSSPYIAMPLLKGQTLHSALAANPKPPAGEVLRIGREMAEGLAAAHAVGLIHRDIKPANVWLEGTRRMVKILDFGLARNSADSDSSFDDSDAPKTQQGTMLGTPAYMSPEQGRGEELDTKSDLFSLGVVLYEMAAGERPFKARDVYGILTALATEQPPAPALLNPAIPEPLSAYIMVLLAKKPEDRPPSAAEVAETLRAIEESSKFDTAVVAKPIIIPNDPWADIDATEPGEAACIVVPSVGSNRSLHEKPSEPARNSSRRPLLIGGAIVALALVLAAAAIVVVKDGPTQAQAVENNHDGPKPAPPAAPKAVPGEFALEFDGRVSAVLLGSFRYSGNTPITLEAWVTPTPDQGVSGLRFIVADVQNGGLGIRASRDQTWRIDTNGFGGDTALSFQRVERIRAENRRTHLAMTRDGQELRLFVDGRLIAHATAAQRFKPSDMPFVIGAQPAADYTTCDSFCGLFHSVRISSSARYVNDFEPKARLTSDADTLALYRFDAGKGDVLKDHSGHHHDGLIVAAKWVKVPPAEPLASASPAKP